MVRTKQHKWTNEQIKYVERNIKGTPYKELEKMLNDKFGLGLNENQIKGFLSRNNITNERNTSFGKGVEAWNKGMKGLDTGGSAGWFTKGQESVNYRPVGSERVCSKDGYTLIKVSDHGERKDMWKLKHTIVWEKHYGKIPIGHAVVFLNSDRTDIRIENLELITRGELVRMNQSDLFSTDPEFTKAGINLVRLNIATHDLGMHGGNEEEFKRGIKIAESNGIRYVTYTARLKRGWNLQDAMNKPLNYTPRRLSI